MTEKQIDRIKLKIVKYKKTLALDKKYWGGYYHDGQGIRYCIPEFYIKLSDYKGGSRYFNWFQKNFPDDSCTPIFLFEWTFMFYKTNKLQEAEKKLHQTFFSNTHLIDNFLGKPIPEFEQNESSNWKIESIKKYFQYNREKEEFKDFAIWISDKLQSQTFIDKRNRFFEIEKLLEAEPIGQKRSKLVDEWNKLRR